MTRNILYRKGKSVETLACFEPDFTMMNEWYKQLLRDLMPTSCISPRPGSVPAGFGSR